MVYAFGLPFFCLQAPEPTSTWMGKSGGFKSLDHHWTDLKFATAGDSVDVWDHARAEPTLSYQWGADSNNCVRRVARACMMTACARMRSRASLREENMIHCCRMLMSFSLLVLWSILFSSCGYRSSIKIVVVYDRRYQFPFPWPTLTITRMYVFVTASPGGLESITVTYPTDFRCTLREGGG